VFAVFLLLARAHGAAAPVPAETRPVKEGILAALVDREAHCTDSSILNLKILDEKLTLSTPYGKLVIPFARINEIECATRIPAETSKRIASAISTLGHEDVKKRDVAMTELTRLHAKAYHALVKAETHKDAEVRRRVAQLLEKIRNAVPEENLAFRPHDVIHTADSKIAGEIEGLAFKVHTEQFGEVRLKLSDIRTIRSAGSEEREERPGNAQPDPGTLLVYQFQLGKTVSFRITGNTVGHVWGTDVYTLDSTLAAAAVHAGAIKAGKTGVVTVKILPARNGFMASARNGVTTNPHGMYPGAFEFVKKKK
jgi:hypothetical protein